jgi:uncharacterized membrane protein YedE/YeeE
LSGEILGASGIVNSVLLTPKVSLTDPGVAWKWIFLTAFSFLSTFALGPYFAKDETLGSNPSIPVVSTWGYLIAGFFVGFGTKLGNGCTSGHGICGMARLSKRSIMSVATFMTTALSIATLTAPGNQATQSGTEWLRTDQVPSFYNKWISLLVSCILLIPTTLALLSMYRKQPQEEGQEQNPKSMTTLEAKATELADAEQDVEDPPSQTDHSDSEACSRSNGDMKRVNFHDAKYKLFSGCLSGLLFATGLAVSGMIQPSKVLGFLNLLLFRAGSYDPTLLVVMMSGVICSFCAYQFVQGWNLLPNPWARSRPILTSQFSIPCNVTIDWQLLVGSVFFGIGWGIGGLCPGPAMVLAATGTKPVLFFYWPMYLVGAFMAHLLKARAKNAESAPNCA